MRKTLLSAILALSTSCGAAPTTVKEQRPDAIIDCRGGVGKACSEVLGDANSTEAEMFFCSELKKRIEAEFNGVAVDLRREFLKDGGTVEVDASCFAGDENRVVFGQITLRDAFGDPRAFVFVDHEGSKKTEELRLTVAPLDSLSERRNGVGRAEVIDTILGKK